MDRFIPKGDRYMRGGRPNLDAADIRHLWDKAKASVKGDPPPEDPKKTFALEVQPEEVKVLYARVLALQSLRAPSKYYSPTFGEGKFSEIELPLYGVLRSSLPASNTKDRPCGGCA